MHTANAIFSRVNGKKGLKHKALLLELFGLSNGYNAVWTRGAVVALIARFVFCSYESWLFCRAFASAVQRYNRTCHSLMAHCAKPSSFQLLGELGSFGEFCNGAC